MLAPELKNQAFPLKGPTPNGNSTINSSTSSTKSGSSQNTSATKTKQRENSASGDKSK